MRISSAIAILTLLAIPALAETAPANPGTAPPTSIDGRLAEAGAAADRDAARWAELEAQAKITDGDYDGAVQAEQQANASRHNANRYQLLARPSQR